MLEGLWDSSAGKGCRADELEKKVKDLEVERDDALDEAEAAHEECREAGRAELLRELADVLALARLADPEGFDYLVRRLDLPVEFVERSVGYQKMRGL